VVFHGWGKWAGRCLADIYFGKVLLSDKLRSLKYVKEYDGGKKEEWTDDELKNIINDIKDRRRAGIGFFD
jgi:hypothetical protein